jgi:hypothetical protein
VQGVETESSDLQILLRLRINCASLEKPVLAPKPKLRIGNYRAVSIFELWSCSLRDSYLLSNIENSASGRILSILIQLNCL